MSVSFLQLAPMGIRPHAGLRLIRIEEISDLAGRPIVSFQLPTSQGEKELLIFDSSTLLGLVMIEKMEELCRTTFVIVSDFLSHFSLSHVVGE